jgi:hypothetical protein
MKLVGIIGMPGCGKTELFNSAEFDGFTKFDDALANREINERNIRSLIQGNGSILVSDIEFCNDSVRDEFQKRIGAQCDWICFENAPWKCAVNCIQRFTKHQNREILVELIKIDRLSQTYQPFGDIREVKQMSLKPFWQ